MISNSQFQNKSVSHELLNKYDKYLALLKSHTWVVQNFLKHVHPWWKFYKTFQRESLFWKALLTTNLDHNTWFFFSSK